MNISTFTKPVNDATKQAFKSGKKHPIGWTALLLAVITFCDNRCAAVERQKQWEHWQQAHAAQKSVNEAQSQVNAAVAVSRVSTLAVREAVAQASANAAAVKE